MDRLRDWIALVDARYPERDAQGWDATGLQVGDPEDRVHGVLVTLDVTEAVLDEAVERGADLVLAHHPLLFRPLARLTPATAAGRLVLGAVRRGVAVLAAHTNLDAAVPGTTDPVARILGLTAVRPLEPLAPEGDGHRVKLVTFVPRESTAKVLAALADAGAGRIGEYDACAFRSAGTGTFRPSSAADPVVGERNRVNEVEEDRVEVVLGRSALADTVSALVAAHPYEEVAWDAYPLVALPTTERRGGIGLVGELPEPRRLRELADALAAQLPSPHLRVAGDLDREVRRVAACGGAGDSLIGAALGSGAQVYVTGDLRHHPSLDALTQGLALVDAGHYRTEAPAMDRVVAALTEDARERGLSAGLLASRVVTEPWAAYRAPTSEGQVAPG